MTPEAEAQLVESARSSDQAFSDLYDHYFPRIYGYVMKRTGHQHEAEDIVAQVFMKVFTKLHTYKKRDCSFSAWIYRIATNQVIDYYRKQGRRKDVELDEARKTPDDSQSPLDDVVRSEEGEGVRVTMATLNERYQKILQLKFYSELSNTEIAEVLNVSANNVGVLVFRALKAFEKSYGK